MMYASFIHLVRLPESACLSSFLMFIYISTVPFAALINHCPLPTFIPLLSLLPPLLFSPPQLLSPPTPSSPCSSSISPKRVQNGTNNQIFIHLKIHVYVDIVKVLMDKTRLIFWVCIEIRMFSCNHLLSHSCHSFPTMAFCHHDVGSSQ